MRAKMYSPNSPVLGSYEHHVNFVAHQHLAAPMEPSGCAKFKYLLAFVLSTSCLALLAGSLASHRWLVARPVRVLRLNGGQTNLTSLMLMALSGDGEPHLASAFVAASQAGGQQQQQAATPNGIRTATNKFQGEIYFGLFRGLKLLNYGFGDRMSPISVPQAYFANQASGLGDGQTAPARSHQQQQQQQQQEPLVDFRVWLTTLVSVLLAILFSLLAAVLAIINLVIAPAKGVWSGPLGLVIWNAAASGACSIGALAWLVEFVARLQTNVLSLEEIQNGWTSEGRSSLGYSYYLVLAALGLNLVNTLLLSVAGSALSSSSGSSHTGGSFGKGAKAASKSRPARSLCEGVIMLY